MKPFDMPEAFGAGETDDISPFFVALEDLIGNRLYGTIKPTVFVNAPHVEYSIDIIFDMSSERSLTLG